MANSFWEVDLNSTFHIDNLRLFNRTDCCGTRLSDYDITIFDANHNPVTTIVNNGGPGSGFHAAPFGTQGRFVRIQLDGLNLDNNGVLSLAEVQVNGGGLANIARNPLAVATQSSTLSNPANPIASDAIDGITNGLFQGTGSDFSVTHTNSETNPFWNLAFGQSFDVDEIVLFNRTDCCSDRLSGAEVRLFDAQGSQIFLATLGNTTGLGELRVDVNNLAASSLRITLPGANRVLSLAEVQVYGVKTIPEPATAMMGVLGLAGLAIRRRRAA